MSRAALMKQGARRALALTCACAGRPWTLAFSRVVGGVSVRAEIRSGR